MSPHRHSVWTIVAPLALIGIFALAVLLVAGALSEQGADPAGEAPVMAVETSPLDGVTVGEDVPASYRIRKGDTLGEIALRYGVTEAYIQALNPGLDPLALIPGDRLKLRDAA